MTILAWFDTTLFTRLVLTFGHFLWQGAAITLIVLVLSVVLRNSSARLRYVFFLAPLMLMAICPVVTFWFVQAAESGPALRGKSDVRAFLSDEIANVRIPADGIDVLAYTPDEIPVADSQARRMQEPSSEQATSEALADSSVSNGEAHIGSRWQWVVPYLTVFYLLGVMLLLGRLLLGLHGGCHLRRQSQLIDEPELLSGIARSARSLGMRFMPTVLYCKQVAVPTVVGVFRPAILLPLSLATGLSPDQVEAVLTHELAHVRRYDHLVNIVQRVIESLLFFHPAVWWVSHRIRVERENCCDDIVVALGSEPLGYAACLLDIAERGRARRPSPQLETVAALHATKNGSQLGHRVRRLVSGASSETLRLSRGGHVLALVCLALMVSGAALLRGQTESNESDRETEEKKQDEPKNTDVEATFVPVIERTLSFGQIDSKPFLQLESGRLVAKPAGLNLTDDADHELLQGTWKLSSAKNNGGELPEKDGQFVVQSGRYQMFEDGKEKEFGTYTIDPSRNPKTIDLHDRSERKRPTLHAIYEFSREGRLRMCAGRDVNGTRRPTSFDLEQSIDDLIVMEFRLETKDASAAPKSSDRDVGRQAKKGELPSKAQPALAIGASNTAKATKTVYIPDANSEGKNIILDLASGDMLPAPETLPTAFTLRGEGDLAYERMLVCLRGAKAMIWNKDRFVPLEPAEQKEDATVYKFPSIPYRALVTTAEERQFDVTVLAETKDGGIVLEYHATAEASVKSTANETDRKRLQAAWKVLSVKKNGDPLPKIDGKYVFHSGRFQIFDNGKEVVSGSYAIDPSRNPKTIDLHSIGQPKSPTLLGIYDFPSAGALRICYGDKQTWRPTSFDSKQDGGNVAVLGLRLETNDAPATPKHSDRPAVKPTKPNEDSNDSTKKVHLRNAEGGPGARLDDFLGVRFILDLASGKTLAFPDDDLTTAGHSGQFLTNQKRGDLFYAGHSLFCLRGAKAMQWDGNSFVPMKPGDFASSSKGAQNLARYELTKFPCRLLITTAEKREFEVNVLPVASDGGIDLEYREATGKSNAPESIGEAPRITRDVGTNEIDGIVLHEMEENEESNAKSHADSSVSVRRKFIGRWDSTKRTSTPWGDGLLTLDVSRGNKITCRLVEHSTNLHTEKQGVWSANSDGKYGFAFAADHANAPGVGLIEIEGNEMVMTVTTADGPASMKISFARHLDHTYRIGGKHLKSGTIRGNIVGHDVRDERLDYTVMLEHEAWTIKLGRFPRILAADGESFEFTNVPIGKCKVIARPVTSSGPIAGGHIAEDSQMVDVTVTNRQVVEIELVPHHPGETRRAKVDVNRSVEVEEESPRESTNTPKTSSVALRRLSAKGNILRWRIEPAKGVRILQGTVNIIGIGKESKAASGPQGVGGRRLTHSHPFELRVETRIEGRYLYLTTSLGDFHRNKTTAVETRFDLPKGSRMQIVPWDARGGWCEDPHLSSDEYANLWEARFVRDGKVVRSYVFVARLIGEDETALTTPFQPRLPASSVMPSADPSTPATRLLAEAEKKVSAGAANTGNAENETP